MSLVPTCVGPSCSLGRRSEQNVQHERNHRDRGHGLQNDSWPGALHPLQTNRMTARSSRRSGKCCWYRHKPLLKVADFFRLSHPGGYFLRRDTMAATKKIISTTIKTIRPMVSVSKSDANEAGKAVLRPCCVELFVVACKALKLLSLTCNAAQHGSPGRTKRG
jgi:hypothetical protein